MDVTVNVVELPNEVTITTVPPSGTPVTLDINPFQPQVNLQVIDNNNHSSLLNLDADDHVQYALLTGERDFTGEIGFQDDLIVKADASTKVGRITADNTVGFAMAGEDNDGLNLPATVAGSAVLLGGEQIGIAFNGATKGNYLRLGTQYDVDGVQVFALEGTPLDANEYERTYTDDQDYILGASDTVILTAIADYDFRPDTSYGDFSFLVQETANRSTRIEYFLSLNGAVPPPTDIREVTIPAGGTLTVTGIDTFEADVGIGDEITIVVRALDTGQGRVTTVLGSTLNTTLTLVQTATASSATAIKNAGNLSTATTLTGVEDQAFRITTAAPITLPENPVNNQRVLIKNISGASTQILPNTGHTIETYASSTMINRSTWVLVFNSNTLDWEQW